MTELEKKALQHIRNLINGISTYPIYENLSDALKKGISDDQLLLKNVDNSSKIIDKTTEEAVKWLDSLLSSHK